MFEVVVDDTVVDISVLVGLTAVAEDLELEINIDTLICDVSVLVTAIEVEDESKLEIVDIDVGLADKSFEVVVEMNGPESPIRALTEVS